MSGHELHGGVDLGREEAVRTVARNRPTEIRDDSGGTPHKMPHKQAKKARR